MNRKGGPKGSNGPPAIFLPKPLYEAFEPKPNIQYWRPRNVVKTHKTKLGGMAAFIDEKFSRPEAFPVPHKLDKVEDRGSKIVKQRWELRELAKEQSRAQYIIETQKKLQEWDPYSDSDRKTGNGYLSLFVGRLNPKVTETELAEFMKANGGEVVKVKIVRSVKRPKSCYAFVEFADDKSLQQAYRATDGVLFGGSYIVVDVERGRTVSAWIPRRFGGGLGGPPKSKGYTVSRGRGPPKPPPIENRKRRGDRVMSNRPQQMARMQ